MRQFINGSDSGFADLVARARRSCVIFYNEELPAGTVPAQARVGFESNRRDDSVVLFVDRGAIYQGNNRSIREWLDAGEKRFANFTDLHTWLRDELAPAYMPLPQAETQGSVAPRRVEQLTDLDEVRTAVESTRSTLLDEDALYRALIAHIRGQEEAMQRLASMICRHITRVQPRRPATLFAIGPTGVGKTKTAETLPRVLNELRTGSDSYGYLRLDMSEYHESHRVSQLLGAPQGYLGYGDSSELLDALAMNPKTIILFDEIEKAHPNILQTLMNAMDAGRLSASARAAGAERVVDCKQAIFLFTSNIESTDILRDLEARSSSASPAIVDDVCRRHLRGADIAPELIGRIGAFMVFRPLAPETRMEIVTLAVARVAEEYGVTIARIEPQIIAHILSQLRGGDFGARPDERLVDDVLGEAFMRAAHAYPSMPLAVCGEPPFTCVPVSA